MDAANYIRNNIITFLDHIAY